MNEHLISRCPVCCEAECSCDPAAQELARRFARLKAAAQQNPGWNKGPRWNTANRIRQQEEKRKRRKPEAPPRSPCPPED